MNTYIAMQLGGVIRGIIDKEDYSCLVDFDLAGKEGGVEVQLIR